MINILAMARKLSRRERYAVWGATGVIGLLLLHQVVITPLTEARERLTRSLAAKIRISEEMIVLRSEYETVKKQAAASNSRFAGRSADFTLFSFLDQLAGQAAVKDHITYMKPSTSSPKDSPYRIAQVEMKFQNMTIEQLTTYLHKVETSANQVSVKRLSISKDSKQAGFIDAVLQVETSEM